MPETRDRRVDDDLRELAGLTRALAAAHPGIPLQVLTAVHETVGLERGLTIDFRRSAEFGHPLVILRPTPRHPPDVLCGLTRREQQVAAQVANGLSNKAIARALHLTEGTVKDHVHRILGKTGFANRTALAVAVRARSAGS